MLKNLHFDNARYSVELCNFGGNGYGYDLDLVIVLHSLCLYTTRSGCKAKSIHIVLVIAIVYHFQDLQTLDNCQNSYT